MGLDPVTSTSSDSLSSLSSGDDKELLSTDFGSRQYVHLQGEEITFSKIRPKEAGAQQFIDLVESRLSSIETPRKLDGIGKQLDFSAQRLREKHPGVKWYQILLCFVGVGIPMVIASAVNKRSAEKLAQKAEVLSTTVQDLEQLLENYPQEYTKNLPQTIHKIHLGQYDQISEEEWKVIQIFRQKEGSNPIKEHFTVDLVSSTPNSFSRYLLQKAEALHQEFVSSSNEGFLVSIDDSQRRVNINHLAQNRINQLMQDNIPGCHVVFYVENEKELQQLVILNDAICIGLQEAQALDSTREEEGKQINNMKYYLQYCPFNSQVAIQSQQATVKCPERYLMDQMSPAYEGGYETIEERLGSVSEELEDVKKVPVYSVFFKDIVRNNCMIFEDYAVLGKKFFGSIDERTNLEEYCTNVIRIRDSLRNRHVSILPQLNALIEELTHLINVRGLSDFHVIETQKNKVNSLLEKIRSLSDLDSVFKELSTKYSSEEITDMISKFMNQDIKINMLGMAQALIAREPDLAQTKPGAIALVVPHPNSFYSEEPYILYRNPEGELCLRVSTLASLSFINETTGFQEESEQNISIEANFNLKTGTAQYTIDFK